MSSLIKIVTSLAAVAGLSFASAQAAPIVFKGNGNNTTPTGNYIQDCGTVNHDYCSVDHDIGLQYSAAGLEFAVKAYVGESAVRVIQDIYPGESGLGALSEDDETNDQTQYDSGESIEFTFNKRVFLTDIEFNSGSDADCSAPDAEQSEGPCGQFDLFIDGVLAQAGVQAVDLLETVFVGQIFHFKPITIGAGFTIAQFDAQAVPLPAALPLLMTGLAGLGFASRRKKKAIAA